MIVATPSERRTCEGRVKDGQLVQVNEGTTWRACACDEARDLITKSILYLTRTGFLEVGTLYGITANHLMGEVVQVIPTVGMSIAKKRLAYRSSINSREEAEKDENRESRDVP